MLRRKLLGGVAASAFAAAAQAAIITPPSVISGIGDPALARQKLGVVGDNAGMLDVTPYGVVADGQNGRFAGTYSAGQATFSMFTLNASVSVANASGQAVVSYPATTSLPIPQARDIGTNLHVPGAGTAGGDFVSPIVGILTSTTTIAITLRDPAPTPFATVSTNLTWPCFSSPAWSAGNPAWTSAVNDVGKWIRISEGQTWKAGGTFPAAVHQYQCPVFGTIASLSAPNACTITFPTGASNIGFTWPTGLGFGFTVAGLAGVEVDWGTDNSAALLAAATAAQNLGIRDLYFPGSPAAIVFAFGFYTTDNAVPLVFNGVQATFPTTLIAAPSAAASLTYRPLFYNNRFLSDGVRSRFFAYTGAEVQKSICPRNALNRPAPKRKIKASRHLPRLASMNPGSTATVVAWSASIFAINPSGGGQSMTADPIQVFMEALRDANRGRLSFWKNSRAIGGQWMAALDGVPPAFPLGAWYANHGNPWFTYINPVPNQAGANVAPDLVLVYEDGSNPRWFESIPALLSVLRKVAGITALNGHPPDVLLTNCRSGSCMGNLNAGTSFNGGAWPSFNEGEEYAATLLETFAEVQGLGFFDTYHPSCLIHDGWSPRHLALQRVASPPLMSTVAPRVPYDLRYQRVRDYSFWLQITASSGANAFTTGAAAVGTLRFKLSPVVNNDFILGVDNATGNFAVMAATYGRWMSDTVSLNSATGVLTCNAVGQRTVSSVQYFFSPQGLNIVSGATAFAQSDWNTALLISTAGLGGIPHVSAISEVYSGLFVDCADRPQYNAGGAGGTQTGNFTIGGGIFVQKDADAQLDIVIFQGNTVLTGKVTGYTSTGQVTTNITGTTLSNAAATIFVGHLSVPWTVTGQNIASEATANPQIVFSKSYNRIDVGYVAGGGVSTGTLGDFWSGDVAIAGGAFCPKVFVTAAGPCTLQASNVRIDRKQLFTPLLTDAEFWGHSASDYDDGGGGVHPTNRQCQLVDEYVLSYQDLSVV